MFQFTIAKIHFLGGGYWTKKWNFAVCTRMTFSSLWDKAVEAILFLRITACLFDVSIVGGSL